MPTYPAAMDNRPLAIFPDPHTDWLHNAAAISFAVSWLNV